MAQKEVSKHFTVGGVKNGVIAQMPTRLVHGRYSTTDSHSDFVEKEDWYGERTSILTRTSGIQQNSLPRFRISVDGHILTAFI